MAVPSEHGDRQSETTPDALLLEALRRGDEAAFASMVDRYHRSLVRLATLYVQDEALAEDVAQDAWLGFLQSLPRFAGRSSVKTWLFRILVNCARSSRRRERRSMPFTDVSSKSAHETSVDRARFRPSGQPWAGHWADPPVAWPEEHAMEAEVHDHVLRVVSNLPPHQRAVLTLRDIEGWSCPEVCAVLDITEGNQRVLLHRARSIIRAELERYFDDGREGDTA